MRDRLRDQREAQGNHEVVGRRRRHDDGAARGYHPHRGGRYDSGEDRSPSPEPPGPRVFSRAIRVAPFPARFRQPANLAKYSGETNLELWLADYRLACQLGGADDDLLIIRNLPLLLTDSARAWLEHLPPSQIHDWRDLVRIFVGNFQGTYVRPGNSWDLKSCRQKPDESLRDFIRRFSKQCTELPSVGDSEIVQAFLSGTTCRDLVRELGRNVPRSAAALLDIATSFASGEEAVGAIFADADTKGKRREEAPEASASHLPKKKKKGRPGKQEVLEADLVVAADGKNPRGPARGPGLFDDMLKKPYPYHQGPVKHTLEECTMLRRYYARLGLPNDDAKKKDAGDRDNDKDNRFPEVYNAFTM